MQNVSDHILAGVLPHVIEKEKTKPTKASLPGHTANTWQMLGCWDTGAQVPGPRRASGRRPPGPRLGRRSGKRPLHVWLAAPWAPHESFVNKSRRHPGSSKSAGQGLGLPVRFRTTNPARGEGLGTGRRTLPWRAASWPHRSPRPCVSDQKEETESNSMAPGVRVPVCPTGGEEIAASQKVKLGTEAPSGPPSRLTSEGKPGFRADIRGGLEGVQRFPPWNRRSHVPVGS